MLVIYPFGEQRSGRLGATIASRNRYGNYYRSGTKPVNPNTARQVAIRIIMSQLAVAWATILTQDQRNAWALYGDNVPWKNKLGQWVTLTGQAHYIRGNAPRLQSGLARVDAGPTEFTLESPEPALVASGSEATQQLTVAFDDNNYWANEDDAAQVLYMGAPQNPGITFFGGPYRYLGVILGDGTTPPTSPVAALDTPDWPFVEGQRIWCRTRITRADGRLSSFAEANFLADA